MSRTRPWSSWKQPQMPSPLPFSATSLRCLKRRRAAVMKNAGGSLIPNCATGSRERRTGLCRSIRSLNSCCQRQTRAKGSTSWGLKPWERPSLRLWDSVRIPRRLNASRILLGVTCTYGCMYVHIYIYICIYVAGYGFGGHPLIFIFPPLLYLHPISSTIAKEAHILNEITREISLRKSNPC